MGSNKSSRSRERERETDGDDDDSEKNWEKTYLFHILPMTPVLGRCSLMLWRRATEMGSSLRFWAVRPSKRVCEDLRAGEGDMSVCVCGAMKGGGTVEEGRRP